MLTNLKIKIRRSQGRPIGCQDTPDQRRIDRTVNIQRAVRAGYGPWSGADPTPPVIRSVRAAGATGKPVFAAPSGQGQVTQFEGFVGGEEPVFDFFFRYAKSALPAAAAPGKSTMSTESRSTAV